MMEPLDALAQLRARIDALDDQLLELIGARVQVVLEVGDLKRKTRTPVYDPERERAMLERLAERAKAPLDRETVRRIFERLIDESRRLEQHHMQD